MDRIMDYARSAGGVVLRALRLVVSAFEVIEIITLNFFDGRFDRLVTFVVATVGWRGIQFFSVDGRPLLGFDWSLLEVENGHTHKELLLSFWFGPTILRFQFRFPSITWAHVSMYKPRAILYPVLDEEDLVFNKEYLRR